MSDPRTPGEGETERGDGLSDREHLTDSSRETRGAAINEKSSDHDTARSSDGTADPEHASDGHGSVPSSSPETPPVAPGGLWRALRRFFWMDDRLAAATRGGFGPGYRGWDEFDLGSQAARGADRLNESEEMATASLLLYRSAAALLAHAHLMRAGFVPSEADGTGELQGPTTDLPDEPGRNTGSGSDPAQAASVGRPLEDPGGAFELGYQAVRAAERLRESGGPEHGALLLLRAAAVLFVQAYLSVPGGGLRPPALSGQDWDRLVRLSGAAAAIAELSPDERRLVTACLSPTGESHISTLPHKERKAAVRVLGQLVRQLAVPLRSRANGAARVILSRWLRITSAVLLAALVTYGVIESGSLTEQNLALYRPVTMSSKFSAEVGRDPSLLVDGDTANLGFHTADAVNQYVTIDLGAAQPVHRVVVYNRSDCCEDRAVPLHIEVSQDGGAYQRVATRTAPFEKWEAKFPPVSARYVKLLRPKKEYFHLAEVEVY